MSQFVYSSNLPGPVHQALNSWAQASVSLVVLVANIIIPSLLSTCIVEYFQTTHLYWKSSGIPCIWIALHTKSSTSVLSSSWFSTKFRLNVSSWNVWYWCVIKNFILHISLNFIFSICVSKNSIDLHCARQDIIVAFFHRKRKFWQKSILPFHPWQLQQMLVAIIVKVGIVQQQLPLSFCNHPTNNQSN